ncbi:enoyl-CoA hydratase/isomerase family protein [Rurimicrobium arvi]|uniref:Enoyl-CoA hydratase-related protein n=1 Tax=Rurimicrobium arvi TaxID=2049916 RepID=A0ABP8MTD9_9BACT
MTLLTDLQDGILIITINRAEKMNALNKDVITDLGNALDECLSNPEVKSVIITGSGEKAFVAGADISEFTELDGKGGAALGQRGQDLVFSKIENAHKPIIAAVNGFALGGGCELAMSCHFRIASENAKFGQPEVNLGLIPGYGGTQRLTQLIGKGKAMELILTGDMIGAEEAKNLGLVNHVFPIGSLLDEAKKILTKINGKAPLAVAKSIALVNQAAKCDPNGFANEVTAFGECFDTADKAEGVAAFLEKRKAAFQGK